MELRCESKRVIFRCVHWLAVLGTCTKEGSEFVAYFRDCYGFFSRRFLIHEVTELRSLTTKSE